MRASGLYFFFFNDTATTEIYTLSLHDALPILSDPVRRETRNTSGAISRLSSRMTSDAITLSATRIALMIDRKSTRLNSSHANISYAVFCLKKKKQHYFISDIPILSHLVYTYHN